MYSLWLQRATWDFFLPLEAWPTLRLRPVLASSDISSLPAFLPPTAAPVWAKFRGQILTARTTSPVAMAKKQLHLWKQTVVPSIYPALEPTFQSPFTSFPSSDCPPNPLRWAGWVTDWETEAQRGESDFPREWHGWKRSSDFPFQISACPENHSHEESCRLSSALESLL